MKETIVKLPTAKLLKEIGFNLPVPHCFIHDEGEEYYLELFSYFLGGVGHLADVYRDEKDIKRFKINYISNEYETYFDYNQDIRKLLTRIYNGVEYMNDPKSYNMKINSYTFDRWDFETCQQMKIELPNYNDGDFDFTVYQDVISAPTQALAQKYLRENHNIDITIHRSFSMSKSYHYYIIIDGNYEVDEDNIQECTPNRSYEQALEDALVKALTLIKNKIV